MGVDGFVRRLGTAMGVGVARLLGVAACVLWLAACETAQFDATGSVQANAEILGEDPKDDLGLGKKHYKEQNYGLAEKHFRRAVEAQPRAAEAWIGLAASYDRLRRFDLSDRAYSQATAIVGPTPEILNNEGFSFMLRGDYKTARKKLIAAKAKDPSSVFIQNNLTLLEELTVEAKGIKSP
jgi:Flp pilus assembly protein TadD